MSTPSKEDIIRIKIAKMELVNEFTDIAKEFVNESRILLHL